MKRTKGVIYIITALVIFAQGLYFNDQWLLGLMGVSILLLFLWVKQGKLVIKKDPIFLYLGGYLLLQCLGYVFFLEKGMLIFGVLKAWFYLVTYLVISQIKEEGVIDWIKEAFVVNMAISGFLATLMYMTGWLSSLAYVIDHRLSGPLQYANTYGILLLCAIMLVGTLEGKPLLKHLLILVLTIPLMLTMSRAIYLIAMVMVTIFLIKTKATKATFGVQVTSIIVGLVILVLFDQTGTAARLTEATGASEWQSRLLYYKDAIGMILKNPMGYGTNGYHYAQSFYQTGSTYHVKYVHSSLLQSTLDTGLLGGLLTGIWMLWATLIHPYKFSSRWVVITLLGHSLIDLDLEFPLVWLLVFVLLYKSDRPSIELNKVALGLVALVLSLGLGASIVLSLAVSQYNEGNYQEAIQGYRGYTEAYRKLLSGNSTDEGLVPYALALVEKNPYVTEVYPVLIAYYSKEGRYDLAVTYAYDYVAYSPILIDHHVLYAETLTLAATYYLADGDIDQAEKYAKAMLLVPGKLAELAKEKNTDYNVNHKPDLRMNRALMDAYIEAGYIMEKINYGK